MFVHFHYSDLSCIVDDFIDLQLFYLYNVVRSIIVLTLKYSLIL